jgi:hypothetical protein
VAFTVARSPVMNGHAKASYCDVVEHLGTWHSIGRRPTPANLSGPAVRKGGVRWPARPLVSSAAKIFSPRSVIQPPTAQIASPARIQAWGSPAARCTAPTIFFSYCTVITLSSLSHKAICRALISDFCVATR